MATASTRQGRQVQQNNLDSSHFYRVVMRPLDHGLKIPDAFMQRYGDSLKKVAILKTPAGVKWKVPIRDVNGETWLSGKGLVEFGEFFSIQKEHFLLFQYKGDSQFHVYVFDNTASEIEYTETGGVGQRVASFDCFSDGSYGGTSSKSPPSHKSRPRSTQMNEENIEVGFKSQYPSFVFAVKKSTISNPNMIHLPITFVRDNFKNGNFRKSFKVCEPKTGKTWSVFLDVAGTDGKFSKIFGLPGFRQFVRDNKLELGEICAFELVKKKRVFNFHRIG